MHRELAGPVTLGVLTDLKSRRPLAEELVRIEAFMVQVHGQNDQAAVRILLLQLIHPGED